MRFLVDIIPTTAAAAATAQISEQVDRKFFINYSLILVILLLGTFVFGVSFMIFKTCYTRHGTVRTNREASPSYGSQEDFIIRGSDVVHSYWHFHTMGLPQSLIDSIPVFKYKRGEESMEASDCSVCLSEFQEEESLRLLPKCCHAFHMPCIDTWLTSHQTCPLCRAPIISGDAVAQGDSSGPVTLDLSSPEAPTDTEVGDEPGEQRNEDAAKSMDSLTLEAPVVHGT